MRINTRKSRIYSAVLLALGLSANPAFAGELAEVEPNDSIADAQNIDSAFSTGENPNIINAETWPWVSIAGTGDGSFDFYSFSVPAAGVTGVFDIDNGESGPVSFDTELFLYDSSGMLLTMNDDNYSGDPGSISGLNSLIDYTFEAAGTYVIVVGRYNSMGQTNGPRGNTPEDGDIYQLQVSLSEFFVDSDGDGIIDDEDCQPLSDLSPTVTIEDCDSGVDNTLMENGCSVADLVSSCADAPLNHGKFSSCVSRTTNALKKQGYMGGRDKGAIQRCAAQSDIGK